MKKACDFAGCNHVGPVDSCTLHALGVGCHGTVVGIGGDPDVRRRLLEMGFCNNATVEVVRTAPMGDPVEYKLRGYSLSLRKDQAKFVRITPHVRK